jgi:hypothetical protein
MTKSVVSLDLIQIASPCHVSWDEMKGDDRTRFCAHCRLNVYNLSEMPREEAEALITKREGRTCVRFFRRQDGTVLTRDCPVGLRAVRQRLFRSVAALAGLALAMMGTTAFGSRLARCLPGGFRSPAQALTNWIEPNPRPSLTGSVVMGGCQPPPVVSSTGSNPSP